MAIERYDLAGVPILTAQLLTGDTVTVSIYEKDGSSVSLDSNSATENVAGSGKYDYELNFTSKPVSGFNYFDIKFSGTLQTVWKSFSWDEDITKFQGKVWLDTNGGGSAGTAYPIGTPSQPVNNLADALTIAARINTTELVLKGTMTLSASVAGYRIEGRTNKNECEIDLNNQDITSTDFENLTLTGTANGLFYCTNCYLENITNIQCYAYDSQLTGTFVIASGGGFYLWRGTSRDPNPIQIDLNGDGKIALAEFSSQVAYSNMSSPASVIIQTGEILVTVSDTVTGGFMYFGGIGSVVDNSTGTMKIQYVLPGTIFDEQTALHTTSGSFGEKINDIPTNPMLDTEDGSSFTAIPDMALDSTVAKETNATTNKNEIVTDLDDIKGTGFVKDTDSLVDLSHGAGGLSAQEVRDSMALALSSGVITATDSIYDKLDNIYTFVLPVASFGD